MKLVDLWSKSILILGFGVEGLSSYKLLRELLPNHLIGVADKRLFDDLPSEGRELLPSDTDVRLHLGENYLINLKDYDVIVKSPGVKRTLPEIEEAVEAGKILTSHTDIFFSNCPSTIIGVTGTKGKGTTSKLIHTILKASGFDSYLVGNIGTPPLPLLRHAKTSSYFVYELSAQQLEGLNHSPHIAVLLNIVPDHLDHFETFNDYVAAKQNITSHQREQDYLVYNAAFTVPRQIANSSKATLIPYSVHQGQGVRCYVEEGQVIYSSDGTREKIISADEVENAIPGVFNLNNVLPAVSVAKILKVGTNNIIEGVKSFEPLANRFEKLGTHRGITFYNASIATVPEVTIDHILSLGGKVQTIILGGFDRGLDFTNLGKCIIETAIRNLILFPTTGERMFDAVREAAQQSGTKKLPNHFFIAKDTGPEAMKEAVSLAYRNTDKGMICLHSPASPSFGLFRDFKERGELFKKFVVEMGGEG